MKRITTTILILVLTVLCIPEANAKVVKLSGVVKEVIDGDTFILKTEKGDVRVGLAGIDAPELKQAYGQKAKTYLRRKIQGQQVQVILSAKDNKGRYLGAVWYRQDSVNEMMVADGQAWFNRRHIKSTTLLKAEQKARKDKKGLWITRTPQEPWIWRQANR